MRFDLNQLTDGEAVTLFCAAIAAIFVVFAITVLFFFSC
jgi:hypothetical protein